MTREEAEKLLDNVSVTVLSIIKGISDKQQIKKPIGIDSVALALRVTRTEVMPIIEHLQKRGDIVVYTNASRSRATNKMDTIILSEYQFGDDINN